MHHPTKEPSPYPGIKDEYWNTPRAIEAEALREFAYSRGVARAHWHSHRHDCPRCLAVRPPAGPPQCCWKGNKLLTAYLKAIAAYGQAKREYEQAGQVTQQTLG